MPAVRNNTTEWMTGDQLGIMPSWNAVVAAVESKLRSKLKLKQVRLTVIETGKYQGTGTGEDGTTYKLKATYRESKSNGKARKQLDYEVET
jgi:hypothetical protein